MRKKLYSVGILVVMAVVLFCGAFGKSSSMSAKKASIETGMDICYDKIAKALKEKVSEITLPAEEQDAFSDYYGVYRITDYYPAPAEERSYRYRTVMLANDFDGVLGQTVHITPEQLTFCDMWEDTGGMVRNVMDNPEYEWENVQPFESDIVLTEIFGTEKQNVEKDYGKLEGFLNCKSKSSDDYRGFPLYVFSGRDDRLLLSFESGAFMLKRCSEEEEPPILEWSRQGRGGEQNLSAWAGRYAYAGNHLKYEIEISKNEQEEYEADIEIIRGDSEKNTKLKAYVCEGDGKIMLVFKECLTGERRWNRENRASDILLSFTQDEVTGELYTDWGELNNGRKSGEVCFARETQEQESSVKENHEMYWNWEDIEIGKLNEKAIGSTVSPRRHMVEIEYPYLLRGADNAKTTAKINSLLEKNVLGKYGDASIYDLKYKITYLVSAD